MIEKFKYTEKEIDEIVKSMVIIVDTREKENGHILSAFEKNKVNYEKRALERCDYSFYVPKNEKLNIPRDIFFDKIVAIERKASLDEIATNWTKERDRFEKEMALAPPKKILLIENASYEDIINGNYRSKYNKKSFLGTLHSFWFKYDLPVIFMPDKTYTPIFIKKYFEYFIKDYLR